MRFDAKSDNFQQVLMLRFGAHKKGKYLVIFFFHQESKLHLFLHLFVKKYNFTRLTRIFQNFSLTPHFKNSSPSRIFAGH